MSPLVVLEEGVSSSKGTVAARDETDVWPLPGAERVSCDQCH